MYTYISLKFIYLQYLAHKYMYSYVSTTWKEKKINKMFWLRSIKCEKTHYLLHILQFEDKKRDKNTLFEISSI